MTTINQRYAKAKYEFSKLSLRKGGKNNYSGYNYFRMEDFVPQAVEIFYKNDLTTAISFDANLGIMKVFEIDGTGELIFTCPMSTASLKGCHEVQNLGAVTTYLRRYLWGTALDLIEDDEIDATTDTTKPIAKPAHKPVATAVPIEATYFASKDAPDGSYAAGKRLDDMTKEQLQSYIAVGLEALAKMPNGNKEISARLDYANKLFETLNEQ
jgi:hypothetical protein